MKTLNNKYFLIADNAEGGVKCEPIKVAGKFVEGVQELAQIGAYVQVTGTVKVAGPSNKKNATTPATAAATATAAPIKPSPLITAHKVGERHTYCSWMLLLRCLSINLESIKGRACPLLICVWTYTSKKRYKSSKSDIW